MTPARSLAASVVALGFTGALSAPLPAFAAPAPCERAESYAAQSGAEMLRIEKLAVQVPDVRYKKPKTESARDTGAAARVLGAADGPIADPEDSDTLSEGIGMLGTAVLGTLTPRPKVKAATDGEADVVTPANEVTGRLGEHGESLVSGLTASGRSAAVSGISGGGGAGGAMDGGVAESRVNAAGVAAARNPGENDVGSGANDAGSGANDAGRGANDVGRGANDAGRGANGGGSSADGAGGAAHVDGSGANGANGADGSGTNGGHVGGSGADGADGDEGAAGAKDDGTVRSSDKDGAQSDKSGKDGDEFDSDRDSAGAEGSDDDARKGAVAESGKTATLSDVGVGETRTAMIAEAKVAAAAYGRLLDGSAQGSGGLSKPLLQKAPPTNPEAAHRATSAGKAGPMKLGAGQLKAHARWDAGMACGRAVGETTRSEAGVTSLRLLDGLVRVPEKLSSESTTALERSGEAAKSVASSTVKAGRIELAGGKVFVRVLRPPVLTTSMSAAEGGKVDYRPAVVEVSGDGIATKRLEAPGDHADITLTPERHATESVPLSRLSGLTSLGKGGRLPVPAVPGLPPVAAAPKAGPTTPKTAPEAGPETESGTTAGTRLRVSLGDVRHATKGTAIAAKATAVKVSLVQATAGKHGSKDRGKPGYGPQARTTLDLAFGVLESAAVSPAAGQPAGAGTGGAGGGLPVTGPRLDRLAMAGGTLLVAGIAAVAVTMRRRRSRH
ncbi:hypothetical protein ACQP2X_01595 [Actinoplanes sp. CA-131856]